MSMSSRFLHALVLGLFACAFATAAQAQATRTWVSGVGDDVNPCSRTAPCKTWAGAISKTATGGTISALDPAGFGAVTITKSITLEGDGTLASTLASGVNGVIINHTATQNESRVVLRNLIIEGSGGASPIVTNGLSGVRVIKADSVVIDHCIIRNFTVNGVDIATTAATNVVIKDTTIDRAQGAAVSVTTTVGTAELDTENLRLSNNGRGIYAQARSQVHAKNTTASGNATGFEADGSVATAQIFLENGAATQNTTGVLATGANAKITLAQSAITGNGTGISATASGQVHSFGNNRISDNSVANGAPTAELGEL